MNKWQKSHTSDDWEVNSVSEAVVSIVINDGKLLSRPLLDTHYVHIGTFEWKCTFYGKAPEEMHSGWWGTDSHARKYIDTRWYVRVYNHFLEYHPEETAMLSLRHGS